MNSISETELAQLIECLRARSSAVIAAQMREAADLLERMYSALAQIDVILESTDWYEGEAQVDQQLEKLGRITEQLIATRHPELTSHDAP